MRSVGFGDGSLTAALHRHVAQVKADIDRYAQESVTGIARDLGAHLKGDVGPLAGLQTDLARLDAFRTNAATASLFAATMQTALDAFDTSAADFATALVTAAASAQPTELAALLGEGESRFSAAIASLNTRVGDRTLLAGRSPQSAALAPAEDILARLEDLVASATGADEVEALVMDWFASDSGFVAEAYLGGEAVMPLNVAPGETVGLDVTAADPALRGTLAGLAIAALLDRGLLSGQDTARTDLARRAGATLMAEQSGRTSLSARLGTAEAAIADASTRTEAEISALEIVRAEFVTVDPFETATRLEMATSRLETLYAITARLSRLSLTDYLG